MVYLWHCTYFLKKKNHYQESQQPQSHTCQLKLVGSTNVCCMMKCGWLKKKIIHRVLPYVLQSGGLTLNVLLFF